MIYTTRTPLPLHHEEFILGKRSRTIRVDFVLGQIKFQRRRDRFHGMFMSASWPLHGAVCRAIIYYRQEDSRCSRRHCPGGRWTCSGLPVQVRKSVACTRHPGGSPGYCRSFQCFCNCIHSSNNERTIVPIEEEEEAVQSNKEKGTGLWQGQSGQRKVENRPCYGEM
ncbi:hypothetical protein B0F90DRAFT_1136891 [Multifurca ochricompacta]|uniref:Uncharacterized protein n=1 Tax=Multifurca ochricompacta TaxID=376703 RepID=A0AAD4LZS9_9AGAM|nr:hypothetical protein B0F90DRAFT_1136891 [Multifurca ochricompacta]